MQCPRCYFSNPVGTRVCEYCGARLDSPTAEGPGSASTKRQTVIGPLPTAPTKREKPAPAQRIDPDDPFRIAARGIGSRPAMPSPPKQVEPAAPPAPPPLPPRLSGRPTLITQPRSEAVGMVEAVVLLLPVEGAPVPLAIEEGRVRVGRRPDAEVVVEDPTASTDHCILRVADGRAWLLDTSANGTMVDGALCLNDRADLVHGSIIEVGKTRLVLLLVPEATRDRLGGIG